MPKPKTKTKPKKENNVVKLEKPKEVEKTAEKPIKEKNFTLDRGNDGGFIEDLNYYYNENPNRWFTTWDAVKLLKGMVSKSSLEKWRRYNNDDGAVIEGKGQRGPQYYTFSPKVVKYKALWLVRFREGLPWENPVVELPHHFAVTASNIPQKKSSSIK